jgi:hypothetical protein
MGLTQEEVAGFNGNDPKRHFPAGGSGKHAPSLSTLKKYARAVGCRLEIKSVPESRPIKKSGS